MSWSTERTGTKAAVRAAIDGDLTKSAGYYAGKEEEKDILAARERVLAAIDAADESVNGIRVMASGSRSDGYLSVQIGVTRLSLSLDAPAPAPAVPAAPATSPDPVAAVTPPSDPPAEPPPAASAT